MTENIPTKCGGLESLGGEFKFTVLKNEDIEKLPINLGVVIDRACDMVKEARSSEGRDPNPEYLVINLDEPYAPEVIEILKCNGHWGRPE